MGKKFGPNWWGGGRDIIKPSDTEIILEHIYSLFYLLNVWVIIGASEPKSGPERGCTVTCENKTLALSESIFQ